ncbi:MAG: DNA-binding protein [Thauera sp.]|nr:DNA-binding protein [Thauera sp.]
MEFNEMGISTEELAGLLRLKPQSLRAALCRDGHYFGLRPRKMPNGRLLWPSDAVERLTSPRVAEVAQ